MQTIFYICKAHSGTRLIYHRQRLLNNSMLQLEIQSHTVSWHDARTAERYRLLGRWSTFHKTCLPCEVYIHIKYEVAQYLLVSGRFGKITNPCILSIATSKLLVRNLWLIHILIYRLIPTISTSLLVYLRPPFGIICQENTIFMFRPTLLGLCFVNNYIYFIQRIRHQSEKFWFVVNLVFHRIFSQLNWALLFYIL